MGALLPNRRDAESQRSSRCRPSAWPFRRSSAGLPVAMVIVDCPTSRSASSAQASRRPWTVLLCRAQKLVGGGRPVGLDRPGCGGRRVGYGRGGSPSDRLGGRRFLYFIQEYGRKLWNYAESTPINYADLEAARVIVKDSLARTLFGTRFEMATDTEQRYLVHAMASSGRWAVSRWPPLLRRFGVSDQRKVSGTGSRSFRSASHLESSSRTWLTSRCRLFG